MNNPNLGIHRKLDIVLNLGLDYLSTDKFQGRDTSYSSNGEIVNGREDFTYDNAENAINQPMLAPHTTGSIIPYNPKEYV